METIRVLLIEDNLGDARLVTRMLGQIEDVEYKLHRVDNFTDGVAYIKEHPELDLVLLDLSLPDATGLESVEKVIASSPHVPVVVLTGHDDEKTALLSLQKGAQDYLLKGQISKELLKKTVKYSIERHVIQKELINKTDKYKTLFNAGSDPIFVNTIEKGRNFFRFIEANTNACNVFGYSKEELLDMIFCDIFHENEDYNNVILNQLMENRQVQFETNGFTKNGEKIPFEISSEIFSFKNKNLVLSMCRNISKRNEAELEREKLIVELALANDELKELSKMKDDFIAIAGHDLRTPFSGILAFSQMLMEDETLSDEHRELVDYIKQNAKIQLEYIDDLLEIIKLQSGKMKLNHELTQIDDVIKHSVVTLEFLAKKKKIDLIVKPENMNFVIPMDKTKIIQVLNNLIGNAVKFTENGGRVEIFCISKDDDIELHVSDNGVGIEEEMLEDIFSPYKQAHTYGTDKEPGSGLGLSICQNIVQLHGGNIHVISKEGQGSDFYFSLPKKRIIK